MFCVLSAAYFNDIIVGAVCSREEKADGQKRLYIMTLGCLAPYRRLGIGLFSCHYIIGFITQGCDMVAMVTVNGPCFLALA